MASDTRLRCISHISLFAVCTYVDAGYSDQQPQKVPAPPSPPKMCPVVASCQGKAFPILPKIQEEEEHWRRSPGLASASKITQKVSLPTRIYFSSRGRESCPAAAPGPEPAPDSSPVQAGASPLPRAPHSRLHSAAGCKPAWWGASQEGLHTRPPQWPPGCWPHWMRCSRPSGTGSRLHRRLSRAPRDPSSSWQGAGIW